MNMREATELEEGRHGTAQMFLFMKHYLVGMYPTIVRSRIEICTTTSVPHINSGEYDIILLPQFVDPPNPFLCSIGHFILNIIDVKEKHVYIVNTLRGIRPKEYRGVSLTSYGYSEVEVKQQTNGTDCGFLCCYYMYRAVKLVSFMTRWVDILRYEEGEYREFVKGLINIFNKVKKQCLR